MIIERNFLWTGILTIGPLFYLNALGLETNTYLGRQILY
jgi:hypothetical protein